MTKRLQPESGNEASGRGRDEESFRRLFNHYYRPLLVFFTRRGLSAEESQDLTQETFLRVYRGMARFRGDSSFEGWLFQIAANVWRNHLRHRSATKRSGMETPLEEIRRPEERGASHQGESLAEERDRAVDLALATEEKQPIEDVLSMERTRLLREALEELPPKMRRCVEHRLAQGLKYREIAAVMGTSIQTVKAQLSRARVRLREKLAGHFADVEIS